MKVSKSLPDNFFILILHFFKPAQSLMYLTACRTNPSLSSILSVKASYIYAAGFSLIFGDSVSTFFFDLSVVQ
jgi:hypothetical protein